MRTFKKTTAIILVLAMMFSTVVGGNTVQAEDLDSVTYNPLTLGTEESVTFSSPESASYFSFTPEASDYYIFKSLAEGGDFSPEAHLYVEENGDMIQIGNTSYGEYNNFELGCLLEAGETYYYVVQPSYNYGIHTFDVVLAQTPVASVEIAPISVIENYTGYMEENEGADAFFRYSWESQIHYTITLKTGEVINGTGGGFDYEGVWTGFRTFDTQWETHWTVGNTYSVTIEVMGCTAQTEVTVVESPVESITIKPISIVENTSGQIYYEGEGNEYFHYNWIQYLEYSILLDTGETIYARGTGFPYNGEYYTFIPEDTQSNNPWKKNNTYAMSCNILGYEAIAQVTITECPIESVQMAPITIIENTTGSFYNEGEEDEWFYYNWTHKINAIITMKNGDVVKVENSWDFYYQDQWYSFMQDNEQHENHWKVGNTYTVTTKVAGYEVQVPVSIVESPIMSFTVEPISIIEHTDGYYNFAGPEDEYFWYRWTEKINYTITMKDNQVYTGQGSGFQYNGDWYSFEHVDNQHEKHWFVGNTYTEVVSVMGCDAEVKVSITESPVESIEVKPIVIPEHTNGHYQYQETPDEWYYYMWEGLLEYTITMKDGEVLTVNGPSLYYEGTSYYLLNGAMMDQHSSHWYAGNTYNTTMNFLGKSGDIKITIAEKNQTDGFEYMVQDGSAIIIGSYKEDTVLNIPSEIGGYPVMGITDLTHAMNYVEELVIPDSVTMLSGSIFEWNDDLKKLTIGKGISNIYNEMFIGASSLEEIVVSEENPYYCSVDGVVYDKEMKTLVVFPRAKKGAYTVPDSVTDIDCLIQNISYYEVQLDLGNSQTDYTVEDGVIYNADKTDIYACDRTKTGKYVMPDTVTTIHEGAFQECSFSEVVVSENVSEIVYAAFSYSMELEKVVLPENLKTIATAAFVECEKLSEADLPSGLEELEEQAFHKTGITSVTIPGTVTQVGYGAYKESQVAELTLEEGIQAVFGEAFTGTQIKSVVIPDSITYMGPSVFADTPLESVTLGAGLEAIPDYGFANTELTTVTIPENIAEIGEYAFANSMLEEAIIQKNDVYIFDGAFYNCPLKEIDLKDGVVAISDYAFYGNQAESIVVPDSVTDVTYKSFAESKKLLDIDVPDDLASIDGTAFDGTAWWDAQADGVVYLENYLYGYKGVMPEGTEITVNDGTTLIANYAFDNEMNLKTLTIPASVKNIGDCALFGCLGLEKVTVAADNGSYKTNTEGTILYNQYDQPLWKRVEGVWAIERDTYVPYGISLEDWLYDEYSQYNQYVGVIYVDGSEGWEICQITADMISGFDSTKPGYQTITVDFGRFTCDKELYVEMPEITGIKVGKLPNKTVYDLNQELKTTGMVVKAITDNGTEFEITDYEVYGFDSSEAGKKTVSVSYIDFETTFEVEVTGERITFVADTTPGETSIQVSAPIEAMEEGAELKFDEKPIEEIKETGVEVPEIFEQSKSQIFDIRFEKEEDEEIKEVQPAEGTVVTVSIPVPEGMDGRNSKIYHIPDEGEPVDMKAVYSEGKMVFDTTHFSYYGIVEVNGSSISGVVNYTNVTEGDVTVTLSKNSEVCDTVIAVDGCYNFTGLEDGTYILKIEKYGHVTREYEVVVGGESVEQDARIRLLGDINGDGVVNVMDANQIMLHARGVALLEGYEYDCANIDGDEAVNVIDANSTILHIRGQANLW